MDSIVLGRINCTSLLYVYPAAAKIRFCTCILYLEMVIIVEFRMNFKERINLQESCSRFVVDRVCASYTFGGRTLKFWAFSFLVAIIYCESA